MLITAFNTIQHENVYLKKKQAYSSYALTECLFI